MAMGCVLPYLQTDYLRLQILMFAGAFPLAFIQIFDDPVVFPVKIEQEQAYAAECTGDNGYPDIIPGQRDSRPLNQLGKVRITDQRILLFSVRIPLHHQGTIGIIETDRHLKHKAKMSDQQLKGRHVTSPAFYNMDLTFMIDNCLEKG